MLKIEIYDIDTKPISDELADAIQIVREELKEIPHGVGRYFKKIKRGEEVLGHVFFESIEMKESEKEQFDEEAALFDHECEDQD